MANLGASIENPATGESMTFLLTGRDTNGELLRIDMRVRPGGFVSGEHIHPRQEERFQIDRGQITLRIRGQERRYEARRSTMRRTGLSEYPSARAASVISSS